MGKIIIPLNTLELLISHYMVSEKFHYHPLVNKIRQFRVLNNLSIVQSTHINNMVCYPSVCMGAVPSCCRSFIIGNILILTIIHDGLILGSCLRQLFYKMFYSGLKPLGKVYKIIALFFEFIYRSLLDCKHIFIFANLG